MSKKYVAVILYHTGDVQTLDLPYDREMAQDIADAVEGQYTYIDYQSGLCVCGENIQHVDIYEEDVEDDAK